MLETDRLILRRWTARDLAPFAALNADPEVMRHFPKPLDPAESDAMVARMEDRWAEDGVGLAVAERKGDGAFLGMVGLARVRFAPLAGTVEVGWRGRTGARGTRPRRPRRGSGMASARWGFRRSSPSPCRPTSPRGG